MSSRPSPLPNRMTPFGDIVATPERMEWMGNRGIIHRDYRIVRRAAQEGWVICRTSFKGRRRELMSPGRYTELFFLDEATALAAGHRPCGECRRADLAEFRATLGTAGAMPSADLDRQLHRERIVLPSRQIHPHKSDIATLPDGSMILTPDGPTPAALIMADALLPWTESGYLAPLPRPRSRTVVDVLTPPTTRRALAGGYRAAWLGD